MLIMLGHSGKFTAHLYLQSISFSRETAL